MKRKAAKIEVAPEVLAALRLYRDLNGPRWRSELRDLWLRGHDVGLLRQARNTIGPSGIDGLDLDGVGTAILTAEQVEAIRCVSR